MTDPLSDVLTVLGTQVTRRTRLEAAGQWALAFPALDRLKFVALLRGASWLMLPGRDPQLMSAGDVCLLGRTTYTVAGNPELPSVDGQIFYDGCDVVRLGGDDTVMVGGSVTFSPGSADFLIGMLPGFLLVPRSSAASGAMTAILLLINGEVERDIMGSEIISARLADVLLVEAIRAYAESFETVEIGGLARSQTRGSPGTSHYSWRILLSHGRWRGSPVWPVCRARLSPRNLRVAWGSHRSVTYGHGVSPSLVQRWRVAIKMSPALRARLAMRRRVHSGMLFAARSALRQKLMPERDDRQLASYDPQKRTVA